MPTDEEMQRVTAEIETLLASECAVQMGDTVTDMRWDQLSSLAQNEFLHARVNWSGFTPDEIADVERRVIEGEQPEFWMDDIWIDRQAAAYEKSYGIERPPLDLELEQVITKLERQWLTEAPSERAGEIRAINDYDESLRHAAARASYTRDEGRERDR